MALPAAEWSVPFDGEPPSPLAPAIERIETLVRALAAAPRSGAIAVPDRPRIVSVFGGRGTGKSTALQFAARRLGENHADCLVLPVIDPETFAPGDTLGGWVFAELQRILADDDKNHELTPSRTVGVLLQQLQRSQAVRSSGFLPGLESRGLTFEDFGRDAVKVPARGVRIGEDWAALVDGIAEARQQPDLQLVIAVDDADLVPTLVPSIVNDAQLLGASSRTAIIFAADALALRRVLETAALASYGAVVTDAIAQGIVTAPDIREQVARRVVKHFPRSLRIELEPLDVDERLYFKPIGSDTTLFALLERFAIKEDARERLSDYFVIRTADGSVLRTSEHARALSDNARDLRQLHEALDRLDPSSDHAAAGALAVLIEYGLDSLSSTIPSVTRDIVNVRLLDGKPAFRFDFRQLRFGKTTGGGAVVYLPPGDDEPAPLEAPSALLARRVLDHYSRHRANGAEEDRASDVELPPQLTYLVILAWEAVQESAPGSRLTDIYGMLSTLATPGGLAWRSVSGTAATNADWPYWSIPDWESFSDYYTFQAGWELALDRAATFENELGRGRHELPEWLLLTHIRLALTTQRDRAVPEDLVTLTSDDLREIVAVDAWDEKREELVAAIEHDIAGMLEPAREHDTDRSREVVSWFTDFFPLLASRLFTTAELSKRLLELWEAHVDEGDRDRAVMVAAEIAGQHLDVELADSDIALLAELEERANLEQERSRRLSEVRRQLAAEHEGSRARILHDLDAAGVPAPILDAIRSSGMTRDVVLSLVASGVRADQVGRLAEVFPPVNPRDDSDLPLTE